MTCLTAVVVLGLAPAAAAPPDGPALYDRLCLPCHGARGDGRGPAAPWLDPAPRDFTAGAWKWTTTGDASLPARADLRATIRWGAPGAMPGFGATLAPAELDAVVDVVLALAGLPPDPTADADASDDERAAVLGPGDAAAGGRRFVELGCPACHGADGRGDGRALPNRFGEPAPARDLVAVGVRRPAPDRAAAVIATLRHGVGGTAMPSFPLTDRDAADLAAFVVGLAAPRPGLPPLTAATIARDRAARATAGGYRPGADDDPDGAPFGHALPLQGPAPAALAPAQASLSSRQCARCHAKQVREWTGTIHGAAASPGLLAQTTRMTDGAAVESCLRCHAPLAEQQPRLRPGQRVAGAAGDDYTASAAFAPALQQEGLTCAACHVRAWERLGPSGRAPSLLPLPGYPVRALPVYERADFCIGCHQLPARLAVAGRPLLDTYREWLLGPYMARGVQCQHCHMPNREHTWKGVHDPETFRQGIAVVAVAARGRDGAVTVRARITNVGAGHYLPTTPTPAAWLSVELVDATGALVPGAIAERRIGRAIRFAGGAFVEDEDTRIAPGASLELAGAWRGGAVARAVAARVRVRVRPDDYYEGLYRQRLRGRLAPDVRAMFEAALARAEASPYVAYQDDVAITTAAPARSPTPAPGSPAAPPRSR
ncbi:MAG: c-type cytochrome [Myxococcales bacterium]|nr:c-type cytochrome [Myxococcales bacterium]